MVDEVHFHYSSYKAGILDEHPQDSVGGSIEDSNRFSSFHQFKLNIINHTRLGIRYKCSYANIYGTYLPTPDWREDGEWAPKVANIADSAFITGFCIELTGEDSSKYKVTYQGTTVTHANHGGVPDPAPDYPQRVDNGENGSYVGTETAIAGKFAWINELRITINEAT